MTEPLDDDMTEIYDAQVPRVDLVGKAANGVPGFLLMKQDGAGLIDPDTVRELIGKSAPTEPVRDDVTITGSPAAVMKMIHDAAQRAAPPTPEQIAEAQFFAGVPVTPTPWLLPPTTSSSLNTSITYTTPQPVAKETPMTEPTDGVAKADMEVADLIADATPGSTAESVPGSPDWEQMDGDTAMTAVGVLGRVKAAVEWLAGREGTEVVTGADEDDASNVWNLEDAACAIDCAIDTLAGFAAGEQLAADIPAEMEVVGKAAADAAAPLAVIESIRPLVKAGRVLSAGNEAAIRGAVESLQKVLASLPTPIPDDQPVTKEQTMTAFADLATAGAGAADAAAELAKTTRELTDIVKAKGDPQVAVYDENGKLIGTVDQTNITMLADPGTSGDAAPAADDPASMTPAPAPTVGTPADAPPAPAPTAPVVAPAPVAKSEKELATDTENVLKSIVDPLVKAALAEQEAAHAALVKGLEDRVAYLEAPATPKTLKNGVTPQLRGQDQGGTVQPGQFTKSDFTAASTVELQKSIADDMQGRAIAALDALHAQRR